MTAVRVDLEEFDWRDTPLGARERWPASLEAIFSMMLASPLAMCATWGAEQTLLYNSAYVPFLQSRHPMALGKPIAEVWSDVWPEIGPLIARVLTGESVSFTDMHLVMARNGGDEDTWWTFSYSPLRHDGAVLGILNIATDTTAGVIAAKQRDLAEVELRERNAALEREVSAHNEAVQRFSTLIEHLPVGVGLLDPLGHLVLSNTVFRRFLPDEPLPSRMVRKDQGDRWCAYDVQGQRLPTEQYPGARALRGEQVSPGIEFLYRQDDGTATWLSVSAIPLKDSGGKVSGVIAVLNDVDEHKKALEDARVNAERVQLALAAGAIIGTWVWDIPTNCFSVDEAFANAFGLDPVLGHGGISLEQVVETVHPDDQAGLIRAVEQAVAQGGRYAHQYRVRRRDGRYYWIEASGYVHHDADGTPRSFPGVLLDIEERRAVEAERDRAEAELRALNAELEKKVIAQTRARGRTWQLSPDLLGVMNEEGYFEASNPAWLETLGWTEAEVASAMFLDRIHPDDIEKSREAWIDATQRNIPALRFENRYRHKGGGWRWLSWVAVPDSGKVYCSARDISEEKERAVELRRYVDIIESDEAPVVAFDAQYRVIAFNKAHASAIRRIFGREARLGEALPDIMPSSQAHALVPLMDRALAGETFTAREVFGSPGRPLFTFELNCAPLLDESGKVIGGFHHAKDISAQLLAHAELEQVQAALRQSQKMEAVGQLTGGLAHDFNNLLAGISGSLDLIDLRLRQGRSMEVARYLATAKANVKRAAALTHRLLAFSRRQTLAPQPADANRVVRDMLDLIERTVGPAISIRTVLASDLWVALVDVSQLENSLLNLCINARDAMPDGGHLHIETCNAAFDERAAQQLDMAPGDYLSLRVSDTGSGMAESVIAKAFDPFFTTKPLGEGTGLGLSMVYGFAKQSGGQVNIDSRIGEGTSVCIHLPRFDGAVVPESTPAAAAPGLAPAGKTVLVVDDESTMRMLARTTLEEAGYTVMEAADGSSALALLGSGKEIDLLITDVGLPGGTNGRQLADAARVARPELPVLFITGYAESVLSGNGQLQPNTMVLAKPFALDVMLQKVGRLFRNLA